MPFGQTSLGSGGRWLGVSADGSPEYIAVGATLKPSTVPTAGSDATFADGNVWKSGTKAIPFGTVMVIADDGTLGPFEAAASDGRQNLVRGKVFILDYTLVDSDTANWEYPTGLINGGLVYQSRLKKLVAGAYVQYVPDSGLLAALPRLVLAEH